MNNLSGSFIVGYDFSDADIGVLVVGTRVSEGHTRVINAFSGKDARAMFDMLTTKPEEKHGNT